MAGNRFIVTQLWQNTVCQLFAQLNAPLVKGEDVQDGALREDFVLVQSDQRARLNGVISRSRMELVGRLPSNTLNGTTWSGLPDLYHGHGIPAQPLRGIYRTPALRSVQRSSTAASDGGRTAGYG